MIYFFRLINLSRRHSLVSIVKQFIHQKNFSIFVQLNQTKSKVFSLTMTTSSSLQILNSYYESVRRDLIESYSSQTTTNIYLQKILSHFQTVINYNVSDGKKLRGATVIDTVRAISSEINDDLLKQAAILGWCIELIQGSFLVADDLMDHSLTRRGKKCWYLNIKNKESAINDAFYLFSCTFTLLNKHFPTNVKLYHLFNEIFQRTVIGQGTLNSIFHLLSFCLILFERSRFRNANIFPID